MEDGDNHESHNRMIISYDLIGQCFDPPRTHTAIIEQAKKYQQEMQAPHRPYCITSAEIEQIEKQIKDRKDDYLTLEDISDYIRDAFHKYPSKTTLWRIIHQRIGGYKIIKGRPVEAARFDSSYESVEEYYRELKTRLANIPVGFCFNLDESGQNEYQDARHQYLIVPSGLKKAEYPVERATKRYTLLHCICTDSSSCDPLIVTPRKTIDDEIFDEIPSRHVMFRHQENGFLTAELFQDWFTEMFVPYLAEQRRIYAYYGKALLIMDGFKGHTKAIDWMSDLLKEINLDVLYLPPHTSDQVQPLDLLGFNLQKGRTAKFVPNPHYTQQTNQILAILDGLNHIQTFHIIALSWQMAGIFRERPTPRLVMRSPHDDTTLQRHAVYMERNTHIRRPTANESTPEVSTIGSCRRRTRYEQLPPDEQHPQRRQISLLGPHSEKHGQMSTEEVHSVIDKLTFPRPFSKPVTEDKPKNKKKTLITDYFKPTIPVRRSDFPHPEKNSLKRTKNLRVAVFRRPVPPSA